MNISIRASVAAILSDLSLAINAGSDRKVRAGDNVRILERVEVSDPDTGESLGLWRCQD